MPAGDIGHPAPDPAAMAAHIKDLEARLQESEETLDAIRRGDGEAAHRAMREHVNLLGDSFADFISAIPVADGAGVKRSAREPV